MPNYQTRKTEEGTEITVQAENDIALVVQEEDEERIFLPPFNTQQDTYYIEPENGFRETAGGYQVFYPGEPDSIELFSK